MRTMAAIAVGIAMGIGVVEAQADCTDLPSYADLRQTLQTVVDGGKNAGVGNQMWGTIVDRDGIVCAVAFTGDARGDQAPGSRLLSAAKANTANAFSLSFCCGGALSSGNLYGMVLEQAACSACGRAVRWTPALPTAAAPTLTDRGTIRWSARSSAASTYWGAGFRFTMTTGSSAGLG
jgi:hypothetical protein